MAKSDGVVADVRRMADVDRIAADAMSGDVLARYERTLTPFVVTGLLTHNAALRRLAHDVESSNSGDADSAGSVAALCRAPHSEDVYAECSAMHPRCVHTPRYYGGDVYVSCTVNSAATAMTTSPTIAQTAGDASPSSSLAAATPTSTLSAAVPLCSARGGVDILDDEDMRAHKVLSLRVSEIQQQQRLAAAAVAAAAAAATTTTTAAAAATSSSSSSSPPSAFSSSTRAPRSVSEDSLPVHDEMLWRGSGGVGGSGSNGTALVDAAAPATAAAAMATAGQLSSSMSSLTLSSPQTTLLASRRPLLSLRDAYEVLQQRRRRRHPRTSHHDDSSNDNKSGSRSMHTDDAATPSHDASNAAAAAATTTTTTSAAVLDALRREGGALCVKAPLTWQHDLVDELGLTSQLLAQPPSTSPQQASLLSSSYSASLSSQAAASTPVREVLLLRPYTHFAWLQLSERGAGTRTHANVMGAHSWHVLLRGTRRWIIAHPLDKPLLVDGATGRVADLSCVDDDAFAHARHARLYAFTQHAGEAVFVPSEALHFEQAVRDDDDKADGSSRNDDGEGGTGDDGLCVSLLLHFMDASSASMHEKHACLNAMLNQVHSSVDQLMPRVQPHTTVDLVLFDDNVYPSFRGKTRAYRPQVRQRVLVLRALTHFEQIALPYNELGARVELATLQACFGSVGAALLATATQDENSDNNSNNTDISRTRAARVEDTRASAYVTGVPKGYLALPAEHHLLLYYFVEPPSLRRIRACVGVAEDNAAARGGTPSDLARTVGIHNNNNNSSGSVALQVYDRADITLPAVQLFRSTSSHQGRIPNYVPLSVLFGQQWPFEQQLCERLVSVSSLILAKAYHPQGFVRPGSVWHYSRFQCHHPHTHTHTLHGSSAHNGSGGTAAAAAAVVTTTTAASSASAVMSDDEHDIVTLDNSDCDEVSCHAATAKAAAAAAAAAAHASASSAAATSAMVTASHDDTTAATRAATAATSAAATRTPVVTATASSPGVSHTTSAARSQSNDSSTGSTTTTRERNDDDNNDDKDTTTACSATSASLCVHEHSPTSPRAPTAARHDRADGGGGGVGDVVVDDKRTASPQPVRQQQRCGQGSCGWCRTFLFYCCPVLEMPVAMHPVRAGATLQDSEQLHNGVHSSNTSNNSDSGHGGVTTTAAAAAPFRPRIVELEWNVDCLEQYGVVKLLRLEHDSRAELHRKVVAHPSFHAFVAFVDDHCMHAAPPATTTPQQHNSNGEGDEGEGDEGDEAPAIETIMAAVLWFLCRPCVVGYVCDMDEIRSLLLLPPPVTSSATMSLSSSLQQQQPQTSSSFASSFAALPSTSFATTVPAEQQTICLTAGAASTLLNCVPDSPYAILATRLCNWLCDMPSDCSVARERELFAMVERTLCGGSVEAEAIIFQVLDIKKRQLAALRSDGNATDDVAKDTTRATTVTAMRRATLMDTVNASKIARLEEFCESVRRFI